MGESEREREREIERERETEREREGIEGGDQYCRVPRKTCIWS